ncbi:MAG TPA: DUF418 domain-containing protein, partial [Caulobacteraceae bacterium]
LLFRKAGDRTVLTLGLVLVIAPPLLGGLLEFVTGAPMPNLAGVSAQHAEAMFAATTADYRAGDYLTFVQANLRYYAGHTLHDTGYVALYDLGVLGLFLLGLWIARKGVLAEVERWRPLLRRVALVCLPVGLALSLLHATRRMGVPADDALYAAVTAAYVGLPIMAFGYAAALALFLTRQGRWLQPALAPMGRMALTGYLVSNGVGAFVWYGWGLGLMGAWNGAAMNLFALVVFVALCLFSAAWLSAFRFGPVEWLWRCVSYGRLQPLRKPVS